MAERAVVGTFNVQDANPRALLVHAGMRMSRHYRPTRASCPRIQRAVNRRRDRTVRGGLSREAQLGPFAEVESADRDAGQRRPQPRIFPWFHRSTQVRRAWAVEGLTESPAA